MLARPGKPFDSPDHLFEIKWDGFRALAFTEGRTFRLLSRNNRPLIRRFPMLSSLGDLEQGLVIDGEIVALEEGVPQFHALASGGYRNAQTVFVAFDLLYEAFLNWQKVRVVSKGDDLGEVVTVRDGDAGAVRLLAGSDLEVLIPTRRRGELHVNVSAPPSMRTKLMVPAP